MLKIIIWPLIKLRTYLRADDPQASENQKVEPTSVKVESTNKSGTEHFDKQAKTKTVAKSGLFAGIGAFLLLASSPAHASISSILKQLVDMFAKMFKPLIDGVMGAFSSILNLFTDKTQGGLTTAFAKGFDAQMGLAKEANNDRVSAATEPPPQMCASDSSAVGITSSQRQSVTLSKNLASKYSSDYLQIQNKQYGGDSAYSIYGKDLMSKYGDDMGFSKLFGIQLASADKISNAEERVLAKDKIDLATYSAMDTLDIPQNTQLESDQKKFLRSMTQVNHIELARSILLESFASRVVVPGANESHTSALEKEVDRTYSSQSYRGELSSYADSTPLVAELNKSLALGNKIALKTLQQTDKQLQLMAVQLLNSTQEVNNARA